jgi:hypothetical protein
VGSFQCKLESRLPFGGSSDNIFWQCFPTYHRYEPTLFFPMGVSFAIKWQCRLLALKLLAVTQCDFSDPVFLAFGPPKLMKVTRSAHLYCLNSNSTLRELSPASSKTCSCELKQDMACVNHVVLIVAFP